MTALTHRTDAEKVMRQDRKVIAINTHAELCPGRLNPGQKRILSGRSMWKGFSYNKGALVRWNRASQVVDGMRWNHYMSSGKSTPFFSHHSDHVPATANGLMNAHHDVRKEQKEKHAGSDTFKPCDRTIIEAHAANQTHLQNETDVLGRATSTHTIQFNPSQPIGRQEETARTAQPIPTCQQIGQMQNPSPSQDNEGIPTEMPRKDIPADGPQAQNPINLVRVGVPIGITMQEQGPQPAPSQFQPDRSAAIQAPGPMNQETEEPPSPRAGGNPQKDYAPMAIRTSDSIFQKTRIADANGRTPAAPPPISEGIMGMPPQIRRMGSDNPAPSRADGYVGSASKRMLMLKTASAAADLPL